MLVYVYKIECLVYQLIFCSAEVKGKGREKSKGASVYNLHCPWPFVTKLENFESPPTHVPKNENTLVSRSVHKRTRPLPGEAGFPTT